MNTVCIHYRRYHHPTLSYPKHASVSWPNFSYRFSCSGWIIDLLFFLQSAILLHIHAKSFIVRFMDIIFISKNKIGELIFARKKKDAKKWRRRNPRLHETTTATTRNLADEKVVVAFNYDNDNRKLKPVPESSHNY